MVILRRSGKIIYGMHEREVVSWMMILINGFVRSCQFEEGLESFREVAEGVELTKSIYVNVLPGCSCFGVMKEEEMGWVLFV